MNDIIEFCDTHFACESGRKWAIDNCKNMVEVWDQVKPEWLVWVATRPGVLDDQTLWLFACYCTPKEYLDINQPAENIAWDAADMAADAAWNTGWQLAAYTTTDNKVRAEAGYVAQDKVRESQAAWLRKLPNPFAKVQPCA